MRQGLGWGSRRGDQGERFAGRAGAKYDKFRLEYLRGIPAIDPPKTPSTGSNPSANIELGETGEGSARRLWSRDLVEEMKWGPYEDF